MKERVSFARPAGLEGIDVLMASGSRRRWSMVHQTFTIAVVTAGRGQWRCRGASRALHAGQIMLIEPGDLHTTTKVAHAGAFTAFFVDPQLVRALVRPDAASSEAVHFTDIATDDERSLALLEPLRRAATAATADPFEMSQLAAVGLRALFERHATSVERAAAASPSVVRLAAERIRAAFEQDASTPELTVGALASALAATPTALIRGFHRAVGLPPYQYLLRLRTELARRMIDAGPDGPEGIANLTDVSVASGFYDLSHMGRVFRKIMGVSPSLYARQIQAHRRWAQGRRA
jgi:AraC-like DNA-binding protein